MNMRYSLFLALAFITGCASFKELEPKPPLLPTERGFIELRNDQENFLLEKEKKYFIRFPKPSETNFYVLLKTSAKKKVHNYFTATFDDGEGVITPIKDEAIKQDSLSVFAIDTSSSFFYWVIDTVREHLPLNVQYRYVAQWRYTVETKHDEYRQILAASKHNRQPYESMGPQFNWDSFDAKGEQRTLQQKFKALSAMNDALLKLEKVFPATSTIQNDTIFHRYVSLSKDTREELRFQSDYDAVLTILDRERETRGNLAAFVERRVEFTAFLEQKTRFRPPVLEYVKTLMLHRLDESLPAYDESIKKQSDLNTFELQPPIVEVEKFYKACGQQLPKDVMEINAFVGEFNTVVPALDKAKQMIKNLPTTTTSPATWPEDSYYQGFLTRIDDAKKAVPGYALDKYERCKAYRISSLLKEEISKSQKQLEDAEAPYRKAKEIVQRINVLKAQQNYKGIIDILRENHEMDFLIAQYSDVDERSMNVLVSKVRERIESGAWSEAERRLAELWSDKNYLNLAAIAPKKTESVRAMEADILNGVKKLSTDRTSAFAKKNETALERITVLYSDSSFLPVYILDFSSESRKELLAKQKSIVDQLRQIKHYRFPESAIRVIYRELTQSPQVRGIAKARAILEHAKFYRGSDKATLAMVDECNPVVAKKLDKPKDYRRIFVLPVNQTERASNEYVFRINIQILTEAKFPVFDINIKVPKEIAENAKTKQWFTELLLNKKVVKTEGFMRIVAPSADNDYEAQITPVQVNKEGENIIDVKFNYPGYMLFEVSVMAQVPLIRKN
ncbi:MAG: hypothetical protein V1799_05380 [bacterium]